MAATALVGIGVALARAERNRRSGSQPRPRPRQFALLPAERLSEGLRRMALEQLDYTIELLESGAGTPSPAIAMHETRKSLKRLRALMSLLQAELGQTAYAREDRVLREAGLRLAGARDAEVILNTLDRLLKSAPKKLARRRGVLQLRAALALERDRAEMGALDDPSARVQALGDLRALRARVAEWSLSDRKGIKVIQPGLAQLYRNGRRRYWLAAAGKGDEARAMHQWRKRVKDLRYAVELLDRRELGAKGPSLPARDGRSGRPAASSKSAQRIRTLAREADELAEMLGEDHDLVLLRTRICAGEQKDGGQARDGGQVQPRPRTRKALLRLIERRRKRLRKRALRRGARLYRRSPKRFLRYLADAFKGS